PGDTLEFHLDKLTPNREFGYTNTIVAPNVLDPDFALLMPKNDSWAAVWKVDNEAGIVTLIKPETKLGQFTLPITPMLGCFGVAPDIGQAISTATSAEHGGNMDYRGFAPGVTVYFPVFVPGALLHVGDAHAVQGHGEIVGTGIEISCDIQFTVKVIKGKKIGWPRGENEEYIFTAGNARPLDQAIQNATSEMLRWLDQDYGLDYLSGSILLGQAVEYEVGNMFDPAYTMICKVPKRVLASLK
ncbi:MAG: acetamidase/formamidase family protein, partial [Burkholderiales bacterium]|nr:acetamidase/formamidase family protein [Anaerolineae bacterium]